MTASAARRRDPLTAAAVALAVVAFAGSFDHVRTVVAAHGQPGWLSWVIAAMPEVSVALSVLKVRRSRSTGEATAWAWVVGGSAAAFTVAANLATAEPSPWGYVVAAWPAWASISAAGLIELRGPVGPVERPVDDAFSAPAVEAAGQSVETPPRPRSSSRSAKRSDRRSGDRSPVDVSDLLVVGQAVAADLARADRPLTRDALRAGVRDRGHTCSTARAQALLTAVRGLERTA